MLAYGNNSAATLAMVGGEVDWAGLFVPDIERLYVARNPEHHRYWFPQGDMIFLYANTQKALFDTPNVRKAISMAIDRASVVRLAMNRYTIPANGTGLSDIYQGWRDNDIAKSATWMTHDIEAANKLLDEAGLARGADGIRRMPSGKP